MHHYDEVLLTPGDLGVAALAQRQHGVVTTAQLHAAGLGRGAIDLRVRRGRLKRLHRGVYAVGHARLTIRGRHWAALLACGGPGRAALSHRTAAAVWDLLPSPAGRYDVTTRRTGRSTPAIRVHRHRLEQQDIARQEDGLALTTPTRTLIELADQLTPHQLTRACHRAEILRILDANKIAARLDELPGRRARTLRAALTTLAHADPHHTRSELEQRFLALIARFALPRPRVNAIVHGHEVDFLWRREKLIVETDGAATHLTATAFERDRRRDIDLQLAGHRVARFTWRRITNEPHDVVARALHALLATRTPP